MKRISDLVVESSYHDKPIVTDVIFEKNQQKKPVVIFCHGYTGYKDWGAWDLVGTTFAENQFFFVKFNFSHNGGTENEPIDFPDLEAFSENNYTTELNDLQDVIGWISTNRDYNKELDSHNITLIGHSRGGGIVVIKASENKKVTRVITWNGVSDFGARFPKDEALELWKKKEVRFVENGRTKQQMPHKYQFYQDFIANEDRLTIETAVKKMTIPQLIINGSSDVVIVPESGIQMNLWNPQSKRVLIDGMNHTLGSKHPWNDVKLPSYLENVAQQSMSFIVKNSDS